MIARTWHGRTKTTDAVIYREYVEATGIKELTSTKGNLGAQIWQQQEGDITHIIVLSWWNDMGSIKAFAGNDIAIAKYYPEDTKYLLELEPNVQHYECYDYKK
ncbi:MAG: hypothetical protein ACM3H8_07570 [Sphingobacteriales bacterium]